MANPQKAHANLAAGLYYAPVTLISEIVRGVAGSLGSGFPSLNPSHHRRLRGCPLPGEPEPMFQDNTQGAGASNVPPANDVLPEYKFEVVHHTLFGTLTAIRNTIALLHKLNYAEPNDWSKPLPTGRPNEMHAILSKRVRVG